ncbi:GATA zinc finger domain-containing protein [Hirsutella rhossiliensis]|uniref:GATA zinc finger domain-containing protein n=1 Tax=Hirsutella rhossiliensis TaxID=111463 RepID=A0A9P8N2N5_9HYPO|nr:GATA zinc finger domain-containing protein [Hirsutella rhossiliensis]KAH0965807.1 GATA zinc finger domain-containing protein [Hirsutella rhossiliensis]
MEDGPQMLPPQPADPISRPSSTSTSASATLPQLPGIAALAASNAMLESPQPRATAAPQAPSHTGHSPAATSGGGGSNLPTCQNCTTSTTPLWRRDEFGAVLCNACGLFLKLHGRPRPISLKTDVIKSRNRVKTMRPDLAPKKKQQQQQQQQQQQVHNFPLPIDANSAEICAQNAAAAAQAIQRAAQKPANGNHEGSDSPISRTGTPSMYNQGLPSFMVDDPYQTGFNAAAGPDGSAGSPMNGDRTLDTPQTHEQLIAHNSSLKTRVSELEVINELFRGRLSQLEQQEAAARHGQEVAGVEQTQLRTELEIYRESEAQLRTQLEDSHRRENILKRRLDELELELNEAKEALEAPHDRPAKKPRVEADATAAGEELEPELETYQEPEPEPEQELQPQLQPESELHPEPEQERASTPASAAGTASH